MKPTTDLPIVIDEHRCHQDGLCVSVCPANIFRQEKPNDTPTIVNEDRCISCGHCVAICPQQAITHHAFPTGTVRPIHRDHLPTEENVLEMIRSRRSIRVFKNTPIEKETLEKVIEAAHFAPTAHNSQSTQYVVVQNKETLEQMVQETISFLERTVKQLRNPLLRYSLSLVAKEQIEEAVAHLDDFQELIQTVRSGRDVILYNAPVVILFYAPKKNGALSDVNASLALMNATYMAQELGLGSFYVGYVLAACKREKRIQNLFGIPADHQICGVLALGYPKFQFRNWVERTKPNVLWVNHRGL